MIGIQREDPSYAILSYPDILSDTLLPAPIDESRTTSHESRFHQKDGVGEVDEGVVIGVGDGELGGEEVDAAEEILDEAVLMTSEV